MGNDLKSIKLENIKAVALCFSPEESLSRADISAKTGLSLVTVGKIADILIEKGALLEEKKINQSVGRRAGLLYLNPDIIVVNAELNHGKAVIKLFDINLKTLEMFEGCADTEEEYEALVTDLFAEAAMVILNKYGVQNCNGIVIMTDDVGDRGRFSGIAQSFFPDCAVYADSVINFSALYSSYGMANDEVLMYGYISRNEVRGAFVLNHKLFLRSDGRAADFGTAIFPGGMLYIDYLRQASTEKEYVKVISSCLYNTAKVVLPDHVVIEVSDDLYFDNMYEMITKEVVSMLGFEPSCSLKIIKEETGNNRTCYHGAMLKIAGKWIENLVLGENGG